MLPEAIEQACAGALDTNIQKSRPVSGGSINQAFRLDTEKGAFFLKLNQGTEAGRMLATEARGLKALGTPQAIRIPRVIAQGTEGGYAYLLLEMVEPGARDGRFWQRFGEELAALHQESAESFGWDEGNFIGSLPQPNGRHTDWPAFYREERLQPQVQMALQSSALWPGAEAQFEQLYQRLPDICPAEPPALTHGDLWGGNFLAADNGDPVLIDPAVSYAHREMDLGMSKLFGGFAPAFYEAYQAAYPTAPSLEERLEAYQLYYLLVHVNLFGSGYVGSTRAALQRYL